MSALVFAILWAFMSRALAESSELSVCATCAYKTIASALLAAPPGAKILINEGLYREGLLEITKPLRLVGTGAPAWPTVDGENRGTVIQIKANGVEISGLRIRNSGVSYSDDYAGIKVVEAAGCRISGNSLQNNQFGIYLGRSTSCEVSGNVVEGNSQNESSNGNGIHVWNGRSVSIHDNVVSAHRDGLYFEFTNDSVVTGNRSFGNGRYGLHFMFSNGNEYRNNQFVSNGSGVAVMYSSRITMEQNLFEGSRGPAAYGILLKDISASTLSGNKFRNNTVGAYLEGTTRSLLQGNDFTDNGWAMRILSDCDGNSMTQNDFLGNTFDVSTNSDSRENRFFLNYWSHYKGLDLNHDRIGDVPYYPVQLSSMLMGHYPASVLLIDSFFFRFIDELEEAMPVLTPTGVKDQQPSMVQVRYKWLK
jgi:nitrous oxidase accessory protein